MYKNGKMKPAETIPGMEWEEDKGGWWRGWINDDIGTSINVTIYPQYNNNIILK
jgi:hypothetical protein